MRCPRVLPVVVAVLLPVVGSQPVLGADVTERPMSLLDCITSALEHNLDIAIERYNPMIAEASRRMVYADYDPQIRLVANHDYNQDPGGIDAQARTYLGRVTDSDLLQGGVTGLLPSGMTYSLGAYAQNTYGNEPPITVGTNVISVGRPFESSRGQVLVGELRQPLLKNFWIDSTRLNLKLRAKDRQVSDLNLRLKILNTVSSVEQGYYDLVAARENVKSAEIAFQLARKLYEENKKRVEVGALAQLDERQAQAQMASSEAAVLEAKRAVDFAENVLKNLLTDNYEAWHTVAIVPTDTLSAAPENLDAEQAWNQAFQLRPDLAALVIDLERRDLTTRYTRNQLFPQLDVFGSVGWQGSGIEFSDALGQVYDGSAPRHAYGASLTFPLNNRRARETHRISQDERAQAELRLRQYRQQIMVAVSDAIQSAESAFQRTRATREARQFAEEALAAEEKKLANGKSTNFEVLRLQRDLTQARFDETRALTDYNKALATVRQRQGTTLLKFDLETPVPPTTPITYVPPTKK